MSFGLYAVGYLVLIAGVIYLAHVMRIPQNYIIGIGIFLLGVGIVSAVQNTRRKDPN